MFRFHLCFLVSYRKLPIAQIIITWITGETKFVIVILVKIWKKIHWERHEILSCNSRFPASDSNQVTPERRRQLCPLLHEVRSQNHNISVSRTSDIEQVIMGKPIQEAGNAIWLLILLSANLVNLWKIAKFTSWIMNLWRERKDNGLL